MRIKPRKIKIPHIGFTVHIKDRDRKQSHHHIFTELDDKMNISVYFNLKDTSFSDIAHEFTHVLQFMCRERGIVFEDEMEHTAYMMQFMVNELFGHEYCIPKNMV